MLARFLSLTAARRLLLVASVLYAAAGLAAAARIASLARTDPTIVPRGEGDATVVWALALTVLAGLAARGAVRRDRLGAGWLAGDDGSVGPLRVATRIAAASAAVAICAGAATAALRTAPLELAVPAFGSLAIACGGALLACACAWRALGVVRARIEDGEARALLSQGWRSPRGPLEPPPGARARLRRRVASVAVLPVAAVVTTALYAAGTVSVATARPSGLCPPGSGGDCRTEIVPLDHRHPDTSRTLSVVYRVVPARVARTGTLVFMTGGPGVRGLAEADERLGDVDPAIRDHFDIVFFDQRGLGGSGGLDCSGAVRESRYDGSRTGDAAFVSACMAELGQGAAALPYLSSREAAEDVEAIRIALDVPRIWVYGESYGTRLAQTYAALHPDRVAGLVLDGAIDVQRPGLDFWRESTKGFAATLGLTLSACASDPACATDVGADPRAELQRLTDRLAQGAVSSPMPDGWPEATEEFTTDDLLGAVGPAMYTESGRLVLLRAFASAERSDWVPLVRLATTERVGPPTAYHSPLAATDPSLAEWTLLGYYAIECADQDYGADPGSIASLEAASQDRDAFGVGFARVVLQERPCAYWPAPVDRGSPRPAPAPDVPTLVLASTGDPVTPVANAERIVARLPRADLVVTTGGPHVTFRRDLECADSAVRAFLVEGEQPNGRRTGCIADVIEPYVPILRAHVDLYPSRAAALDAIATEFTLLPEVRAWDGLDQLTVACAQGGTARLTESILGLQATLDHCTFVGGLVLDGIASSDPLTGRLRLGDLR